MNNKHNTAPVATEQAQAVVANEALTKAAIRAIRVLDSAGASNYERHDAADRLRAALQDLDQLVPPEATASHQGMTIAGDGAAMLGKLMREQYATRGGVYPDGNPNAGRNS